MRWRSCLLRKRDCQSGRSGNWPKEFADRILANGDLNENATNYAPLGTAFFLELLALEGRTQELRKNAGFRNQFSRWRDFAGPAVIFPEIGDAISSTTAAAGVVMVREAGARLFDDPSFAAEAGGFMQRDNGKPDDDLIFRALPLMELDTYHSAAKPAAPALSQVQYRAKYGGNGRPTVPDKLILRTGSQPGDAMIMLDLYARGSHAHEFHRPSIAYFEAGGAALFHNLGRRGTTSGNHANVVWLEEAFDRFPGHPKPGVWNTMTIPVNRLQPAERAGEYRLTNRLDFRTFRQPTLKSITFDNLRLEGTGGTLLIDGFESPGLWTRYTRNLPKISIETVDDRTEGVLARGSAGISSTGRWSTATCRRSSAIGRSRKRSTTLYASITNTTVRAVLQSARLVPGAGWISAMRRWSAKSTPPR